MSKIYDLTHGSIFKKIMAIALPVLLTSISQMAYNLTDMFWVGQVDTIGFSESDALSAIGTAGYILWFSFGLILIGKIGTSVKVSHYAGDKNLAGVKKYASNGLMLEIIFGLVTSAVILLFRAPLISMFGNNGEVVYNDSIRYLAITGGFYFVQFITSGFTAINEGLGKTYLNLLILPIGLIINMILDPILILVLGLGVTGAALATVIAQICTLLIYVLVYLLSKQKVFSLHPANFDSKAIKDIIRIGFPAGLQSMFFTACSIIIGIMVYGFGTAVFAAQRVGSQIEQFTWMIAGGFQTALTVFVGQNYGARDYVRIRQGTAMLAAILIPYSVVITIIFFFKSEFLIRLFLNSDETTVAYGAEYLKIISFSQIFMMLEGIGSGLFNGVGKTKIPSIFGIIGNVMRIPLSFLMIGSMAQVGIWWALNISDGFKGMALLIGGVILINNMNKLIKKNTTIPNVKPSETDGLGVV
ncbi:MAG: MATE family efflux transporter [Candidatus Izemoplasmatales bacterium]|jgi:putative MATE family efflux protein|nr:MATE family efflux transporter [Candidatus Izemoplasmatales bacterium]MDD3865000.1 MATE family efflux transporter [Candidatus Izemoplasmatales bacterium]